MAIPQTMQTIVDIVCNVYKRLGEEDCPEEAIPEGITDNVSAIENRYLENQGGIIGNKQSRKPYFIKPAEVEHKSALKRNRKKEEPTEEITR